MTTIYSAGGIAECVDGHAVSISVGRHLDGGEYVADRTYRCQVAPGYEWLTPVRVAGELRSALSMADARGEAFNFRRTLDSIARSNLAGPYALIVI
jgi:hypothetical protein